MAEKFFQKLKQEVEEKGLKLSITENGKECVRAKWSRRVNIWKKSSGSEVKKEEWKWPIVSKRWELT